jgi:hypothetical protein
MCSYKIVAEIEGGESGDSGDGLHENGHSVVS